MHIEELKSFLKKNHLKPKFELGQNFLMNEDVLDVMVESSGVRKGDVVIEVGPGIGNLTERLLKTGAHVLSIEKDTDFKKLLQSIKKQHDNFEFILGDALRVDFLDEVKRLGWKGDVKVVANIPYYLTGALMKKITDQAAYFFSLTLLVQKEVALNLTAKPGKLNLAGLALQLKADTRFVQEVPARDFFPAPKVDSGVVHAGIYHPQKYKLENEKLFFKIARAAFLGKRKQIHNTLENNLQLPKEEVEKILVEANIESSTRPQELRVEEWMKLYEIILERKGKSEE